MARRAGRTGTELNLLRHVPGSTPMHKMWPGSKLIALGLLSVAVFIHPGWPAVITVASLVGLALLVARIPRGAFPHLPRWFWIAIGIAAAIALAAGESPNLGVAGLEIGLGGLLQWARFLIFTFSLGLGALLIGWTTSLADLAPALRRLLAPLRMVRMPVDELVTALSLSVRCLPLIAEEVRILQAARRVRQPVAPVKGGSRIDEVHDVMVTALVSSVRRAREMADAIDARGGPGPVARPPVHLAMRDYVVIGIAFVAAVGIVVRGVVVSF